MFIGLESRTHLRELPIPSKHNLMSNDMLFVPIKNLISPKQTLFAQKQMEA